MLSVETVGGSGLDARAFLTLSSDLKNPCFRRWGRFGAVACLEEVCRREAKEGGVLSGEGYIWPLSQLNSNQKQLITQERGKRFVRFDGVHTENKTLYPKLQ